MSWRRRFLAHGVFWRQLARFAARSLPVWMEPPVMAFWSAAFLLWGSARRSVMRNLSAIRPGATSIANFFRALRVFWNFAWTITDNMRFSELRTLPDWEFVGFEYFERLRSEPGGAIILTAHMGSYDLAAQVFAEMTSRRVYMVRAPETDPQTQEFERGQMQRTGRDDVTVEFNTKTSDLALDLLAAIQRGELIAIQGDRVTPGIAAFPARLFGKSIEIPSGPFALAMAARVPIYPLFVIRAGRRRYRLHTCAPIVVQRTTARRDDDLRIAVDAWARQLETIVDAGWYQWFAFETFSAELAA